VSLGHKADLVLITPISANTLAKLATGIADNLLTVTVLASSAPLINAPAMDVDMYQKPITQEMWKNCASGEPLLLGRKAVTWLLVWLDLVGCQNR
jgi:phosphopantothenoylcysteine decarboxylase/phosphopantothenate--cysteine ligase